jgi:phosphatidylglycerophosphate synthase
VNVELSFRVRLLVAALAGALTVTAAGGLAAPLVGLGASYGLKAGLTFAVVMGFAAAASHGHPGLALGPANIVTTCRAMGVALVTGLIGEPATASVAWAAVATASVMAGLDGADGWLARRTGMASAFGERFDMETDALLILVLSILVWQHGKADVWILAGGAMRYAFAAAGMAWPWLAQPLTPTLRGKTVAVVFSVGLIVALAPVVPPPASAAAAALALMTLTWSFSVDVRRLHARRALEE